MKRSMQTVWILVASQGGILIEGKYVAHIMRILAAYCDAYIKYLSSYVYLASCSISTSAGINSDNKCLRIIENDREVMFTKHYCHIWHYFVVGGRTTLFADVNCTLFSVIKPSQTKWLHILIIINRIAWPLSIRTSILHIFDIYCN